MLLQWKVFNFDGNDCDASCTMFAEHALAQKKNRNGKCERKRNHTNVMIIIIICAQRRGSNINERLFFVFAVNLIFRCVYSLRLFNGRHFHEKSWFFFSAHSMCSVFGFECTTKGWTYFLFFSMMSKTKRRKMVGENGEQCSRAKRFWLSSCDQSFVTEEFQQTILAKTQRGDTFIFARNS